jgi:hypothetical protein
MLLIYYTLLIRCYSTLLMKKSGESVIHRKHLSQQNYKIENCRLGLYMRNNERAQHPKRPLVPA